MEMVIRVVVAFLWGDLPPYENQYGSGSKRNKFKTVAFFSKRLNKVVTFKSKVGKNKEKEMSGRHRQDIKKYQEMSRYNLKAKSLFHNGAHAQQTPSSTYFLTDKITRDSGVLLNLRQRLRLIKNPDYLRRSGIPLTLFRLGFF